MSVLNSVTVTRLYLGLYNSVLLVMSVYTPLFLVFHFLTVAICTTPPLFVDGCEAGRWWRGRRRWTGRAVHLLCRKGGLRNIKAHGYINLFVISIIYSYYKGSIVVGSVTPAYSHTTQQTKVGLYNSGFRERPDRGRGA